MSVAPNSWFYDTASALAYSLAKPHENSPELQPPHNDLTRFIVAQQARLPDYLRTPIAAAAVGFDMLGLLARCKRFHHQAAWEREKQIAHWKSSRLSFKRDFVRYFESLATLALYSRGVSTEAPCFNQPELVKKVGMEPTPDMHAQIVVIGSGPGGAITACLLAEAGRDVLLVEEGPFLPLTSCEPFSLQEMEQKYRNGGQTVALGKNKIAYVEGRCVGGGSEINSGLYHRTPAEVLERWRKEFGVEALTENELLPHFETLERDLSVSAEPGTPPLPSLKLQEGAARLRWKSFEVPRWFRYEQDASSSSAGERQSMTETFIPRFIKAGGRLLPETRVLSLRQDGARWYVSGEHRGRHPVRIAAEAVFLCAGAVHTPSLLRRSGVTGNIGNSLQVHPTVKLTARFADEVNKEGMGVPAHQVKEFSPRLSFGCSISSPPYLALSLLDHPEAGRRTAQNWSNMAVYYAMTTPEGRGTVRTLPAFQDPLVRYTLTEADRRNLADGMRKLAECLFESGATAIYPNMAHGPVLHCKGCLSELPDMLPDGLASLMTIHLFSSCPMGEDKRQCATDSFGRVHGFTNLFVNDASLLCTAPGANPQGTIMAVARRNALHYLGNKRH
jgi:choline dehydrogenase-like flavoprotein